MTNLQAQRTVLGEIMTNALYRHTPGYKGRVQITTDALRTYFSDPATFLQNIVETLHSDRVVPNLPLLATNKINLIRKLTLLQAYNSHSLSRSTYRVIYETPGWGPMSIEWSKSKSKKNEHLRRISKRNECC